MRRYLHILLTICLLLALSGCSQKAPTTAKQTSKTPTTPQTYNITAPKAGKIVGLIAEKGERISKDQPLFAMYDEELSKQMSTLVTDIAKEEAKLKVMQTGVPSASGVSQATLQARYQAAQEKAAKMNNLYAQGAISRRQAEAAQAELAAASSALASGGAASTKPASKEEQEAQGKKIAALKEQQNKTRQALQKNEVVCPATSIVKEVKLKNGDMVTTNQLVLVLEEAQE